MNTGQLVAGASYDLDFDHQFIERACQVDQNGTTIQTQHLLQQTIQHNLGARID